MFRGHTSRSRGREIANSLGLFDGLPPDFNWKTYLDLNPDLRRHGITTYKDAVAHYRTHGRRENRRYLKSQGSPGSPGSQETSKIGGTGGIDDVPTTDRTDDVPRTGRTNGGRNLLSQMYESTPSNGAVYPDLIDFRSGQTYYLRR